MDRKKKILTTITVMFLMGTANATTYFSNISDMLSELVDLAPKIVDLVMALLPLMIAFVVVYWLKGLFQGILGKLRGS